MNDARLMGLLKIASGIAGCFVVRAVIPILPKLAALPLAFALAGLLEVVSGVPFKQLQERWDFMSDGQRFLLGLGIAFCVLVGMIVYFQFAK